MADSAHASTPLPAVRHVTPGAPLRWLARGWADLRAHPLPSAFYGASFALMGWLVAVVFEHAAAYVASLVAGFFLVGPFLATGLYALSRRRERGESVTLAPTLDAWRPEVGAIGVFALFYTQGMPSLQGFLGQLASPDNLEFLFAYACVGGFFALLTFAISVVSVPMMLDRGTDGVVAVLTSVRAFGANLPAMLVWGAAIVVVIALGFALAFVGLVVAVPLVGHATWHAYRDLVE